MTRMLGRARWLPRDGRRDDDLMLDGPLARRQQRRRESCALDRELRAAAGLLPAPLDDPSDCQLGCNGACILYGNGSEACDFTCHEDLA